MSGAFQPRAASFFSHDHRHVRHDHQQARRPHATEETPEHYSFDASRDALLPAIAAIEAGLVEDDHHKQTTSSALTILPRNVPTCVCTAPPAPFGSAKLIKYIDPLTNRSKGKIGFNNKCAPQPRMDTLAQLPNVAYAPTPADRSRAITSGFYWTLIKRCRGRTSRLIPSSSGLSWGTPRRSIRSSIGRLGALQARSSMMCRSAKPERQRASACIRSRASASSSRPASPLSGLSPRIPLSRANLPLDQAVCVNRVCTRTAPTNAIVRAALYGGKGRNVGKGTTSRGTCAAAVPVGRGGAWSGAATGGERREFIRGERDE